MQRVTMMELKLCLLNLGLIFILCLEPVFGAKAFVLEPEVAQWEDAMIACDNKDNIMVPGRRFRVKVLASVMSDGDKLWLYGWRSVSDITPDSNNKLRTLKVDFAKPRSKSSAIVCRKDSDLSYFVGTSKAKSVTEGRTICEGDGGTLVDITTEDDAANVISVTGPDDPHWANSISSEASKIKQCLYAHMVGTVVKYQYGDCNAEHKFICIQGKDFSPLISLKIARFDEFEDAINEYTESLMSSSSSSIAMETTTSIVMLSPSSTMPDSSSQTVITTSAVVVDAEQSTTTSQPTSATSAISTDSSTSSIKPSVTSSSPIVSSYTPSAVSYSTVTPSPVSPDTDRASDLFAGVLIKNKTQSSSDLMTSYSSSTMTSVSYSSKTIVMDPNVGMSTSSAEFQPSLDYTETTGAVAKTKITPSLKDTAVTPSMDKYKSVVLETSSSDDVVITPPHSLSSSTTDMYDGVYPDLPKMETQTTSASTEHEHLEETKESITSTMLNKYDDTTQIAASTSSQSSSSSVTVNPIPLYPIYHYDYLDYIDATTSETFERKTPEAMLPSYTTPSMSSKRDSIETPMSSSSEYVPPFLEETVNVVDPVIAIIRTSMYDSTVYTFVEISPSPSATHSEQTSDMEHMASDYFYPYDYTTEEPSSKEYTYPYNTPYFVTPDDTYTDQPVDQTPPVVTTEPTDDTDISIEDDLDVEEYDEDNISANVAKSDVPKSEEGIEVGVWIAFAILIALVIVSLVLAFFLYRRRKQQKSKDITPANGAANTGAAGDTVELRDSRSPSRENGKANEGV